jgi:hypothetical protein
MYLFYVYLFLGACDSLEQLIQQVRKIDWPESKIETEQVKNKLLQLFSCSSEGCCKTEKLSIVGWYAILLCIYFISLFFNCFLVVSYFP